MESFPLVVSPTEKRKTRRYSPEEWEVRKSNIQRLYITEDRPLKAVIQILEHDFKFLATEKQLKSSLTQWGFDIKNVKTDIVICLARRKAKRALQNKKSIFRVNKTLVDDRRIDRCLQRNDISEDQLLSMASPANLPPLGPSACTPQPVRPPSSDQNAAALPPRPPTPRLNFQTLSLLDHTQPPVQLERLPAIAEETENVTSRLYQSSSPLYIQPGVENNDTSELTTCVTLPDGAILIVFGEPSILLNNPEEVDLSARHDNEDVSANTEGIHRPSPRCAWPTRDEAEADTLWKNRGWHGRRNEYGEEKSPVTPSTKVPDDEARGSDWQPRPVTYSNALEFECQQIQARSQKKDCPDVDFTCIWSCVSIISVLLSIHAYDIDAV